MSRVGILVFSEKISEKGKKMEISVPSEIGNELSKEFILSCRLALRGRQPKFTIQVPEGWRVANQSKTHYTYKVGYKEFQGRSLYMAYLLTGGDNENSYGYLGLIHPETGDLKLTDKSVAGKEAWSYRLLRRTLNVIWSKDYILFHYAGFKMMHSGKCAMCGRTLTTPESLKCGLGPECRSKF